MSERVPLYIVVREGYASKTYLRLDGPFQYPEWMSEPGRATPLTAGRASQWSIALPVRDYERLKVVSLEMIGANESAPYDG